MRSLRCLAMLLLTATATATLQAQDHHLGILGGQVTRGADRPQGAAADVPRLVWQAHSVFLSNAGSDAGLFPHPFSGTQDRAYARFYERLAASGRFTMASVPADGNLVLELSLASPSGPLGDDKQKGTADPLPTFKLVIYDNASHYILWTITQTIDPAALQKNHDKNFDDALDALLAEFLRVATPRKK